VSCNPRKANSFIALISAAGLGSVGYALTRTNTWHPGEVIALTAIAIAASRMKIKLPRLNGSMSVNLPFVLIAVVRLSLLEALLIALASTAVQSLPAAGGKPKLVQMLFNVCTMASAVGSGRWILHHQAFAGRSLWMSPALLLSLATASFFLIQTIPVAFIISLTEGGSALRIWSSIFHLSFPYYVLSAGVTSVVTAASQRIVWQVPLLVLPAMYGVYCSYRLYFGRAAQVDDTLTMAQAAGKAH
jgi:hypothetical protein